MRVHVLIHIEQQKDELGKINESLILAQNQRWRRASDMQVERLNFPSGKI